uniref:Uncharacterized protein n=1 Tax=viral metagenome TaxID=1070528 RepID=A0A6M3KI70_9ZZZZ
MEFLTSLFTGPIGAIFTGVFGSLISNVFNYFKEKQLHKQKLELLVQARADREIDHRFALEEADKNMQIRKAEIEGAIDLKEAEGFIKSQEGINTLLLKASIMERMLDNKGKMRWATIPIGLLIALLFGMVDFVKHMMRPGLTLFLIIMFANVLRKALAILENANYVWAPDQAVEIVMIAVNASTLLTVTAVSWWFCDRQISKFVMRKMGANVR